jgi:hypothetical protein
LFLKHITATPIADTTRENVVLEPRFTSSPAKSQAARRAAPVLRQIVARGRWAIATDGAQWILRRRRGDRWQNLSFVRTTRDVLARCMRENGARPDEMVLLARLPDRFQDARQIDLNTCSVRSAGKTALPTGVTS